MAEPIRIDFIAKWTASIIVAIERAGTFQYEIKDNFIPISEISKPYNVHAEWTDEEARKALLASDAVDLVSSFTGYNVDMTKLIIEPKTITHRFFSGAGATPLEEGDAMLVLIPML